MVLTEFIPEYYRQFQCIGGACEDTCCQGWTVDVDKTSYKRLMRDSQPEIRGIARNNLKLEKHSVEHWAQVRMTQQGQCPFLDSQRLCLIHKHLGPEKLPSLCRTYPRYTVRLGEQRKQSLSLACPEACRQLLLHPDAVMLQSISSQDGTIASLPDWCMPLNLMVLDLFRQHQLSPEVRLFAVGLLCQRADRLLTQGQGEVSSALAVYCQELCQLLESGTLTTLFDQFPAVPSLRWQLIWQVSQFAWLSAGGIQARGCRVIQPLVSSLLELTEQHGVKAAMAKLHEVWTSIVQPFMAERPHIWNNYLFYLCFHDNFPLMDSRSPYSVYRLLVADYFLLTTFLCTKALSDGGLNESALIEVFYAYHSRRKHNLSFVTALDEALTRAGIDSDTSLCALLVN